MSKTVCIVGAGPSGLVAAKTLLHGAPAGASFEVTIFDSQSRIGGLWPISRDDEAGLLHPLMVSNQSKHTMHYSDLAWPEDAPQLPRAWQVGRYLERYQQRYCQAAELRLGCRVEETELLPGDGASHSWRVQTRSQDGTVEQRTFDYLLVASGFFGKPALPPSVKDGEFDVPVVHSSKYRDLEALLGDVEHKSGTILVVGGQMSGVEIAGTIASHLSSAIYSPGSRRKAFVDATTDEPKFSICHLTQRPTWVFPLTTSPKPTSAAPPFVPLDLGSYNLANRPSLLTNTQGHIPVETARAVHSIFRSVVGTDQSVFSPVLAVKDDDLDQQPFLTVSDSYMDFVRSGTIRISRGKLESLSGDAATISPTGDRIPDLAAVVLATGFDASSSLSFLPGSIQQTLSMSPADLNNTVALAFHGTHHPAVPNLGFVGFYRSPYWGVMEMQARFLTAFWAAGGSTLSALPPAMEAALRADTSIERSLALRTDPRASQFPMGDYPWLMQEFAAALDLERVPHLGKMPRLPPGDKAMNILTPSRYPGRGLSPDRQREVEQSLRHAEATAWAALRDGRFVARAVFRSLLGEWRLERKLTSRHPSQPSGRFTGTAKFLLREATRDGRDAESAEPGRGEDDAGLEYLYVEDGLFVDEAHGLQFKATRRYVWRYDERRDKLSVWFVKTEGPSREARTADYLFHEIEIAQRGEEDGGGWEATAGHLCVEDFYDVRYNFAFEAVNLREWTLGYVVHGPSKDYTIHGVYKR